MPAANDKWANPQNMWNERFSQPELVYGEAPNAFLEEQASRLQPGMKVFVPADGYGCSECNRGCDFCGLPLNLSLYYVRHAYICQSKLDLPKPIFPE